MPWTQLAALPPRVYGALAKLKDMEELVDQINDPAGGRNGQADLAMDDLLGHGGNADKRGKGAGNRMDHEAVLPDRVREPGSVLVIRLPIQNEVRSLQNYRRYVLESIAQGILVLGKDVTTVWSSWWIASGGAGGGAAGAGGAGTVQSAMHREKRCGEAADL